MEVVTRLCATLDEIKPKTTGKYQDMITFVEDRPGHDARYSIDATRIRKELGWRPSVTFEEGIKKTVHWYLENQSWWQPLLSRMGVGELGLNK